MTAADTDTPTPERALAAEDYLLLTAVLALPWAFGGVEIWAYRGASLLLVAGAALALVRRGWSGWGLGSGARWLLPAFLLAAWAAFQVVPLPPGAIRLLSPEAYRLYSDALPAYADPAAGAGLEGLEARALEHVPEAAGVPLPEGGATGFSIAAPACLSDRWRTLSLEPSVTRERLFWYLALLIGFLVLRERAGSDRRRAIYLAALLGTLTLLAAFGLVQDATWNGRLYWFRRLRQAASPFGPYVNPVHFAGAMELAVPVLAGYAWSRLRRDGRRALGQPRFVVPVVAAGLCTVAAVVAASKMSILLIAAGLIVLAVLGARDARTRAWVLASCGVVLLLAAGLLARTEVGERFRSYYGRAEAALPLEGRLVVWQAAGQMIEAFPLTGTGFGTFPEVFPRYTPPGSVARWAEAHNDYLEVVLDGGIVAAGLVVWLAWGFARSVARRMSGAGQGRSIGLGLLAGVASLAVHAVVDFNHQVPGNALMWVALCALLVPVVEAPRRKGARTR